MTIRTRIDNLEKAVEDGHGCAVLVLYTASSARLFLPCGDVLNFGGLPEADVWLRAHKLDSFALPENGRHGCAPGVML
jgi:hypothetical protein